jgi:uncharacterized protein YecT (DUF1311 family)
MRSVYYFFSAMTVGIAISSASQAQSTQVPQHVETADFTRCMANVDLSAFKTSQWLSCYADEMKRQDKILNDEYKELQKRIPADAKAALAKAEIAWLNYREARCRYEEILPMAPSGDVNFEACLVEVSIDQINTLRKSFK